MAMPTKEETYQLRTYAKMGFEPVRGEGPCLWDAAGKRYLDFYGGHAVASTGHCHPEVVAAIREQAGKLLFYSNAVPSAVRGEAAEALVTFGYPGHSQVFLTNSGAEANEAALKMARKFTGREEVVFTEGSFHGRSLAALSVCGIPKYRSFRPEAPGTRQIPFGDAEALKAAVTEKTAALLLEPVQSVAGMRTAPAEYFRVAREITEKQGACLIFDEVQTALGRTGHRMVGMHWGVEPDLATSAKGVASGLPVGVTWIPDRIAKTIALGDHGATFGGGPTVSAAAVATLRVLTREKVWESATRLETKIRAGVAKLGAPYTGVRGMGLLLGVELAGHDAKVVAARLLELGAIVNAVTPTALRLAPSLLISDDELDLAVELIAKALA